MPTRNRPHWKVPSSSQYHQTTYPQIMRPQKLPIVFAYLLRWSSGSSLTDSKFNDSKTSSSDTNSRSSNHFCKKYHLHTVTYERSRLSITVLKRRSIRKRHTAIKDIMTSVISVACIVSALVG